MRTKDQILQNMEDEMPFYLDTGAKPYIKEAMQVYAIEQLSDMIDFIALVNDMRKQQKLYFHTREMKYLQKAKALEKDVDDFMKKHFVIQKTESNGTASNA